MNPEQTNQAQIDTNLEKKITAALERKPEITVPVHFTASLMAALPAQRITVPQQGLRSYSRTVIYAGMLLLVCAMVVLPAFEPAAMASTTSAAFCLEMLFAFELILLAMWVGVPDVWRSLWPAI